MNKEHTYLFVNGSLTGCDTIEEPGLVSYTERHRYRINVPIPPAGRDPRPLIEQGAGSVGVIFVRDVGWMSRLWLRLARTVLERGERVYFYFPDEESIEVIDRERLRSLWILWAFQVTSVRLRKWQEGNNNPLHQEQGENHIPVVESAAHFLARTLSATAPVPFPESKTILTPENPLPGTGLYLRFDFWANIATGGSYGHTCYVAKELARRTEKFLVVNANRYALLDKMGIDQLVPDAPSRSGTEEQIIKGSVHYYTRLKALVAYLKPTYIYERLVLGNVTGARLSQEFGIPYIIEYNGSEVSMKRSFGDGKGYDYETFYLNAEMAAFRQATTIVVISSIVKSELVERGVPEEKILVNPNGADTDDYTPLPYDQKRELRHELGYADDEVVCGFIGTFGGWHGIDVMAEGIPKVCFQRPKVRWLLVGDGAQRNLVDDAVNNHGLADKVRLAGSTTSSEGLRYMQACDILVSPHSSDMVDSRFFGSPTKLFEYMALGGAIVGSDLEQIGQVLRPALTSGEVAKVSDAGDARAVLCAPGNVDDFVDAVVTLAERPDLMLRLGANAREAAIDTYSWSKNVERIFASHSEMAEARKEREDVDRIATGDGYKEQTQNQWDNDPCGSHYVKGAERHSLAWYKMAEEYRYGTYAPWMHEDMEFARHAGEKVLEIGAGMGTDLSQFAANGALVTDVDLSGGHLALAKENFSLRGLNGTFIHHDAETLPFEDNTFDVVYSNGVIHHTPNTYAVVDEIFRVLKPGGKAIIMVYAEHSLHYWYQLVYRLGFVQGRFDDVSIGEIMSESVEISQTGAKPLVKVYNAARLREMFRRFDHIDIIKRQLLKDELPRWLKWVPLPVVMRIMGWNLVVKAVKPKG